MWAPLSRRSKGIPQMISDSAMISETAAMLIIQSHWMKQSAETYYDLGDRKQYSANMRAYERLRNDARKLLAKEGIEDISGVMDALAIEALRHVIELHSSIMQESLTVAKELAALGFPERLNRLNLRKAPPEIRYAREIARHRLGEEVKAASMAADKSKKSN